LSVLIIFVLMAAAHVVVFRDRAEVGLDGLDGLANLWIDDAGDTGIDAVRSKTVLTMRDATARLNWVITGVFQTLALVLGVVYFSRVIYRTIPCQQPWVMVCAIWVMLILAGIGLAVLDSGQSIVGRAVQ